MESIDIWQKLAENGSIVLLMGVIIVWLLKKLKEYEKKIDGLNDSIHKINKDNLTILSSVNASLDKFIEAHRNFGEKVVENQNSKAELITEKIEHVKHNIEMKIDFLIDNIK